MRRVAIICVVWAITIALACAATYWVVIQQVRSAETAVEAMPDLKIVQPLTEFQRNLLLRAPSVNVAKGMVVTLSEPGKPLEQFLASICGPRGKLDLDPCESPKKPEPPVYKPPKEEPPPKVEVPDYVPYPCRVGTDSAGKPVWGVCFRRRG